MLLIYRSQFECLAKAENWGIKSYYDIHVYTYIGMLQIVHTKLFASMTITIESLSPIHLQTYISLVPSYSINRASTYTD